MTELNKEGVKVALERATPWNECGYIHLEWLRDVAPDLAREYLRLMAENERLRQECSDLWNARMNPYDQPPQVQTAAGFLIDDLIKFYREIRDAIHSARAAMRGE